MKLSISDRALADIEQCIRWSAMEFGIPAAQRYEELINVAIEELVEDPGRHGFRECGGVHPTRLHHLRHSRKNAVVNGLIVKSPGHFIAYRILGEDTLQIARLLHDSMELEDHLFVVCK